MKFKGRPPKFQDADELVDAIDKYFEMCDEENTPYTVSGLALTLGISVVQLRDYKNCANDINVLKQLDANVKQELSFVVKRAYDICENYAEAKMLDPKSKKTPVGYIFALKNFGHWVDKQEIINTSDVKEKLSESEIDEQLKALGHE